MKDKIAKLEVKRARLHQYIIDKLEDRDYHGVADGAMDLRELEVAVNMLNDEFMRNISTKMEIQNQDMER